MYNLESINNVKAHLLLCRQTLAVAESVTSGHLQAAFSLAENASQFFQGGITVYNVGQKSRHLHIEPIHALACDSVSVAIAETMAIQATTLFTSDWGIGITGYASSIPGKASDKLFAYYSIAFKGCRVKSAVIETTEKDSLKVQVFYTNEVIRELADVMLTHP
jgi:nicotinamide-nucleotide amidase